MNKSDYGYGYGFLIMRWMIFIPLAVLYWFFPVEVTFIILYSILFEIERSSAMNYFFDTKTWLKSVKKHIDYSRGVS